MSDSFILPFDLKQFKDDGDCLSAIIHSLFEFYNIQGYEMIFKHQGWLTYSLPVDAKSIYNANDFLRINYGSYFDILASDFGIKTFRKEFISCEEIKDMIYNNIPILVEGLSYYMPWRECRNMENRHWCLIIGFDNKNNCFLCIDPIFQSEIVSLPFSNMIWDSKSMSFYFLSLRDFCSKSYDLLNLRKFYFSPTGEQSWDSLVAMSHGIVQKTISGTLPKDEYCEKYLFSDSSWFLLFGRSSKIALFYQYLSKLHNDKTLLDFADKSYSCFLYLKENSMLKLKYLKKKDPRIAVSIANNIDQCAILEKMIYDKIVKRKMNTKTTQL